MTPASIRSLAAAALAALPALALAHPAAAPHAHGFLDGLAHPLGGLDHLGAMLAVGALAARAGRRAWLAPTVFVAGLLAGALAAAAGLAVPAVDPLIAFSLFAFGVLLAWHAPLAPAAVAVLAGGFAWFHGAAHGAELGAGAALAGMVLATALLHAAGVGLGLVLRRQAVLRTGSGLALAGLGLSLLAA